MSEQRYKLYYEYQGKPSPCLYHGTVDEISAYLMKHSNCSVIGSFVYSWYVLRDENDDRVDPETVFGGYHK